MSEARPLHQACPYVLAPVSQGASVHVCLVTRPGHQGVGVRPWEQRSPAKSRPSRYLGWAVRGAVSLALGLVLTGVGAQAAEEFQRLSAQEIRARIIGNVITDDTHWSQHFRPDGTLHALALSRLRQGTWHIDDDTLCRTLTRRGKTTTTCSEVWMWQDRVEYREQGVTVMEGFVRKEWR
jgi:hypothetical protein